MKRLPTVAEHAPIAARSRWDDLAESLAGDTAPRLWRRYCDGLNADLVEAWVGSAPLGRCLKTDLYDEVAGEGLAPLLAGLADEVHGVDVSARMVAVACARHPSLHGAVADVRDLPFADSSFDLVVSNSTLDHFDATTDITRALDELYRVLEPGGRLVLTLDNLANPLVALRQRLPLDLLQRIRLVPYPVGQTLTPAGLRHAVQGAGFLVLDERALMHAPRVLAVWGCRLSERLGDARAGARALRLLRRMEGLAGRRGRYRTGYYAAVLARRPSEP